jgi:hypothetical protein
MRTSRLSRSIVIGLLVVAWTDELPDPIAVPTDGTYEDEPPAPWLCRGGGAVRSHGSGT